jgi:hypothetical protein
LGISDRFQHAWNALMNRDPVVEYNNIGHSSWGRPDRIRLYMGTEKSIVSSIYNRIAIDVSAISIKHIKVDKNDNYIETIDSYLNDVLTVSANKDQTGRALIQDLVMSMFDEGCVAVVPTDTTINPILSGGYDITSLRVGRIIDWYPDHIKINLYNERTGLKEDIILPKDLVAIIENPLYAVMNEPNSILKRLISKLNLLDAIDQQSGSGKLDLIIQLPYVVKTQARKEQADIRRQDLENQLKNSKYGIGYTDGTEKITQLNRPVENNLMAQVTYLTNMLFNQLGITESIFAGTADEKETLNYYNRTVEPILSAIADEFKRKFLTKTARTQKQTVKYFREPFKLVPVNDLAEIADKFTRNEILSSNEFRAVIGYRPSTDPKADELRNSNMPEQKQIPIDTNNKGGYTE